MPKFNEYTKVEKIALLKDEFIRCAEEMLSDPTELKKLLAEDKFSTAMKLLTTELKPAECACGMCVDMEKLDGRIPEQLECLLTIARTRCEQATY